MVETIKSPLPLFNTNPYLEIRYFIGFIRGSLKEIQYWRNSKLFNLSIDLLNELRNYFELLNHCNLPLLSPNSWLDWIVKQTFLWNHQFATFSNIHHLVVVYGFYSRKQIWELVLFNFVNRKNFIGDSQQKRFIPY